MAFRCGMGRPRCEREWRCPTRSPCLLRPKNNVPPPGSPGDDPAEINPALQRPQNSSIRKYGNSQGALAAVLRDVDFRGLPAFHRLRGTVWFWICGIRFRMEQLSRAKLLVCYHCRFYGNPSGGVRLRDLDRCSLVDFRKPRSIPLKPHLTVMSSACSIPIVRTTIRGPMEPPG
jgi:hypothetical protein